MTYSQNLERKGLSMDIPVKSREKSVLLRKIFKR
jgi:hypothetical protein